MLTRNYYNTLLSMFAQSTIPNGKKNTKGVITDAGVYSGWLMETLGTPQFIGLSDTVTGIVFGTGSTPPTIDDYKLESIISGGLTGTFTYSINNATGIIKIILTNTSGNDITISEIGWQAYNAYKYNNSASNGIALMDRTVLDTPVTIEASSIGVVEYKLDIGELGGAWV